MSSKISSSSSPLILNLVFVISNQNCQTLDMSSHSFYSLLFYWIHKSFLILGIFLLWFHFVFLQCQFAFSNWLPNNEYSNLLVIAAFSNKSFSGKTSLPVKNSYLMNFPDDKAEVLVVFLYKLFSICRLFWFSH